MTKRSTVRAGILSLGLAGALLVPTQMPHASADQRTIPDARAHNQAVQDIRSVTVRHTDRKVVVRTKFWRKREWVNVAELWIDARPRNPGPEFVVTWNDLFSGSIRMDRVTGWGWNGAHKRPCPRATVSRVNRGDLVVRFPRRCLKLNGHRPARIRVAAHTYDEQFMRGTQDWAPLNKRFGNHFVPAG